MNTTLKAAVSLLTLGGVSTGGYILAGNYNDDAPIYIDKENASLQDTREIFLPKTMGYRFPSIFLSTRAVKNQKAWEAKKAIIEKVGKAKGSFFTGLKKDDEDLDAKIKGSCLKAYKEISPETDSSKKSGYFLMSETKWWEVWMMCGHDTTPKSAGTQQ